MPGIVLETPGGSAVPAAPLTPGGFLLKQHFVTDPTAIEAVAACVQFRNSGLC